MATLPQQIREHAVQLGFALAGITTPEPPPHWPAYQNWLAMGRHGQMAYLANDRARSLRQDPLKILPECKSIVVLAARYPDPKSAQTLHAGSRQAGKPRGRVAAYAWGTDYHLELPKRMRALVAFIEGQVGRPVPNRCYTDTGPILERDLAQRAGLGWIGKNTNLINPRLGSYFLLAEILLGLELEPDPPFVDDRCGTCTRCIDACPTNCILPDRTIDARNCISYLTIELKDSIPEELRPKMKDWIFGCDVCQEVCPWNRFAASPADEAFAPRPGVQQPDLVSELELSPQDFKRRFKDSPILRPRWRGYQRNVAIAAGNAGDPAAVPGLEHRAEETDSLVRETAGWALDRIHSAGADASPESG